MARRQKKPGQYDCASCDGEQRKQRRCLMFSDTVRVSAQGISPITITRGTVNKVFKAWTATGRPQFSELETLELFGICPVPLITPFSTEAMKVYSAIDGLRRLRTLDEYYNQPAIYHDICNLLDAEKAKWQATQTN